MWYIFSGHCGKLFMMNDIKLRREICSFGVVHHKDVTGMHDKVSNVHSNKLLAFHFWDAITIQQFCGKNKIGRAKYLKVD